MAEPTRAELPNGAVEYRDDSGLLHRVDGPALVSPDGGELWCQNGYLHRTDGPAVVRPYGYQAWHLNDRLHRADGPAVTWPSGDTEWWINGVRRLDLEQEANKDD